MFDKLFQDGKLRTYIDSNVHDPWEDTPFKGYVYMSPKQKGEFGERFVSSYMMNADHIVKRAKTSTAGHDRVIDDIRTEIKFSLATRNKKGGVNEDQFIINHVSKDKDWQRLIFFGINPDENNCRLVWFTKEDFLNNFEGLFMHQQGGKGIKNDDFICTKVKDLLKQKWVKDISLW